MSRTTKFCNICEQRNNPPKCPGFLVGWEDSPITECPFCKNKSLITYNISDDDILIMGDISKDKIFFQSMLKLKEENPIEYQLKISQFKANIAQQKSSKPINDNKPKCPTCGSTNIEKIGGIERGASVAMWGIFSKKINKSFKCKNCGYTW